MKSRALCCLTAVVLAGGVAATLADPPKPDQAIDLNQVIAMAAGATTTAPGGDESGLPKFEDVTKGMTSQAGLFTLWFYPPGTKDKDSEKLLCQIPASFLGEQFMLSISVSGGGFFTGFPLEERVVRWELLDKQLLLIEPETLYTAPASSTVADVVQRTYPERIRTAQPLVTRTANGDPVIDLGAMLKSNFADISWMSFMPGMGFGMGGGVNPSLSKWTKKKTFPLNVEIGVELAMAAASPPGSYEKKMVHFSFWKLPASDYQPRIADDRVGYFLTAHQDWSKPTDARDLFNRFIDRWHLVKRDPSLPICEPRQPIVFYIEKTVPVRFRKAVRDGILEWNKAYEKVGFANAVEVRQQTDDNEWKDLDPEDMRYSFFRWIVTGAGFAMGPHRANPFTGQIYDADIIFDDSMVRYFEQSLQNQLPTSALTLKTDDPTLSEFLRRFPQWKRSSRDWEQFVHGGDQHGAMREALRERMRERGLHGCDYAEGMKHQLAFGGAMLAGQPPEVIERFLYDVVKEVVMHEVGHTLGLRHNFKASSVWTIAQIRDRKERGQATTGSVMDYNPVLFFKDRPAEGNFVTPTIGPYDFWAIEYGYAPADGNYAGAEKDKKPTDAKDKPAAPGKADAGAAAKPAEVAIADKGGPADQPSAAQISVAGAQVPQEVLDQLPPDVRKMIESGGTITLAGPGGQPPASGARPAPAMPGVNPAEAAMLQAIASRCNQPELAYATDEDTTFISPDPRSNRFDMGADPIDWARTRIELVDARMDTILDWAVRDQESWYHLRNTFVQLLFEKATIFEYVGRYIGGQHVNRAHRGDPDSKPPFELVDPKTQREALAFIEKNLFRDEFFRFSPDLLNHLAAPRWWHAGSSVSFTVDFPIHDLIGVLQWWQLFDRLFPNTLRRIHDAELKSGSADRFTVAEYLQRIRTACWADVTDVKRATGNNWSDASPFVSSIRRSLQREYLNLVEPLVRTPPGAALSADLHAMVQQSLRELGEQIGAVNNSAKLDFASAAHLTACKNRIDRILAPELNEYGGM
ncbi:MAG: zinc-dependent metalloprotease [Phycisphaerae bacterium]|nr:zinc-dependent metalloprotease [Phycisphaerae bacterium]NUQ45283.1 zinc-dependent metalloprotease [Phycisphaerae bacterium]